MFVWFAHLCASLWLRQKEIDSSVSGRFSPVSLGAHLMTIDWLIDWLASRRQWVNNIITLHMDSGAQPLYTLLLIMILSTFKYFIWKSASFVRQTVAQHWSSSIFPNDQWQYTSKNLNNAYTFRQRKGFFPLKFIVYLLFWNSFSATIFHLHRSCYSQFSPKKLPANLC